MDIRLIDIGQGGEAIKTGGDLMTVTGLNNFAYISMFGGNPEADTPNSRIVGVQNFDYWANGLLFGNDKNSQMNSFTERTMDSVSITSDGRSKILAAVQKDIEWMKEFAEVNADVLITGPDRVEILISITEPNDDQEKVYKYIWDGTKNDFLVNKIDTGGTEGIGVWFLENNFIVS